MGAIEGVDPGLAMRFPPPGKGGWPGSGNLETCTERSDISQIVKSVILKMG
jgi:hypothetical protein